MIRSLGFRSEAVLVALDGQVRARRGHVVLARPALPDDAWHNLLVLPRPPRRGDLEPWLRRFDRELGVQPGTHHVAFGWDSPGGRLGHLGAFLAAGFALVQCSVHVARPTRMALDPDTSGTLRRITAPEDWAALVALQAHGAPTGVAPDLFAALAARRMARFRRLSEAGCGAFWGAFAGGGLAAACGVFGAGGLARYQAVVTHRDHRGQGLCGQVMRQAAGWAGRALGARLLVVTAELGAPAGRVYERLGFPPVERMVGLVRGPR